MVKNGAKGYLIRKTVQSRKIYCCVIVPDLMTFFAYKSKYWIVSVLTQSFSIQYLCTLEAVMYL